jgi:UDP-GlcNAc3NAcA epimerase
MHVVTIVGARPQFIKAAVISRAIAQRRAGGTDIAEDIIHTGQHYDSNMSNVFFQEMEIPAPSVNLGIASRLQGEATGAMLASIEVELLERRPDVVVVYGDTNSTLAGALAAAKLHLPLAHVEAGLRSYNRRMPEELNRVLTDHASDFLLCPTSVAVNNLSREGIVDRVFLVGDVMYDAALHYRAKAKPPKEKGDFALGTIHRSENTDDATRLAAIVASLGGCPLPVILPLHPRTREAVASHGISWPDNVRAIEPASYFEMLGLLERCRFVLTDSGGLQKEAYFFGKPCVTLRDETEWTELVDAGVNRLTGTDSRKLRDAFEWAASGLQNPIKRFYGDGSAGEKIVDHLLAWHGSPGER